jgi:hypothetical protein
MVITDTEQGTYEVGIGFEVAKKKKTYNNNYLLNLFLETEPIDSAWPVVLVPGNDVNV